jgi:hypothetical protein
LPVLKKQLPNGVFYWIYKLQPQPCFFLLVSHICSDACMTASCTVFLLEHRRASCSCHTLRICLPLPRCRVKAQHCKSILEHQAADSSTSTDLWPVSVA